MLYITDYQVAVETARAEVQNHAADLKVKRAQAARREALTTLSTTTEEKQVFSGSATIAEAAYATARSQLAQADKNLQRTQVRSPANGYVTNLLMRVGDYATAGSTNISVVDADSFWIDGYLEETKVARIHLGDGAEAKLMGYPAPVQGRVRNDHKGYSNGECVPKHAGIAKCRSHLYLGQACAARSRPDQNRAAAGRYSTCRRNDRNRHRSRRQR